MWYLGQFETFEIDDLKIAAIRRVTGSIPNYEEHMRPTELRTVAIQSNVVELCFV